MHHPTYYDKSWQVESCLKTCEGNNEAKDVNSVKKTMVLNKVNSKRKKEDEKVTNNEEKILNIIIMNW